MNRKKNLDNQVLTADMSEAGDQLETASREPQALPTTGDEDLGPLFSSDSIDKFRSRWDSIQTGFVDEPRKSVDEADKLVAEVMKETAVIFTEERDKLEKQWDGGDDVSTEDLRLALQRYRVFFNRLLAM
jgi:hypothetical protein